ncbi:MAG: efflux RND transporter periplasmic adaptor subunit [Planctomycetes bacterium]|nr:efflux RND transporter periplasmic adaptor subunit [Planctomycetota bacterium]MBZ0150310.1 efflux RND transporter periplasmic adaptor subunit [Planctomycetota bacterium]MCC7065067.1 efflux RND transporter periplasmic adaptor subunit [Planctomycetota bacterium]
MSTTIRTSEATKPMEAGSWWKRNGRRVTVAVRLVLVLSVALGAAWWFLLASVAVTTHTVVSGTISAEVMGTGTLESRTSAIIGPKIGGLIVRIAADQGDHVKDGALLFQLEDSDVRQQVGMAEAEVAAATATLDRLKATRNRAEAVLAQARIDRERVGELTARSVVSQQDLDKAVEALSIADSELSVAEAAIIEGQKRLLAAERSLEYQRARLHDTTIEAPFDALVVRRDREPGDVVTAGSSVLQLVSTDEMWITAWVDETELSRLAEGQPARVVFRSEPGVAYGGVVARIGREVDRETREIVVDVRVQKLPANWAVGQRAEVYITVDRREDVTKLPAALVLVRGDRTGVMLDLGGEARWREITVGLRGRESVEVTGGLSPGDVVVNPGAAGSGSLRDGRRIRPR